MKIAIYNTLKNRNCRLFFTGQFISLVGTWMQKTAVSWLVYLLTHSKFMLGVSLFASMFPSFLFSFIGGIIADRYNRLKLLLITQIISMAQAILLAILIFFKQYNVVEILALSALLGIVNAFDVPARQSLVYEIVDNKNDLPNTLAFNSLIINLSKLIGPGIAGFVIERFGNDICFGLNALSFITVIASLLLMKLPTPVSKPQIKSGLLELREGVVYLKKTPSISLVIIMLGLISLFVLPFTTLIPVYAKDIFKGTAYTFGMIDSAIGLGALCGAFFFTLLKPDFNLKKMLAVNTLIFGAGLALFSHTIYYPLALIFVTISAFGTMAQITISNIIIQTTVDPDMRGRVISFYAMAFFGLQPFGGLIIGYVSENVGVQNTTLGEGLIAILIGMIYLYVNKEMKSSAKINSYKSQL